MRHMSKSKTGKRKQKSSPNKFIGRRVHVVFLDHGTFNDEPDSAKAYEAEVIGWLHSETPEFIRVCTWRFDSNVADHNNVTAVIVKGAIKRIKFLS
jgi:hypothetical protein